MSDFGAVLTPIEQANLLAGQAVAYATAFLDGRHDAAELARNGFRLRGEISAITDPATNGILDPVRLLNFAMMHAASAWLEAGADRAAWHARQDRWQQVMGSLVELVRSESRALIPAQRTSEEVQS